MGYAARPTYTIVSTATQLEQVIAIDAIATDYIINSLTLPEFRGTPDLVYVDVFFMDWADFSGVNNYIESGYTALKDSGGTLRNAATIPLGAIYVLANQRNIGQYMIPGYVNLANYVSSGGTYDIYFNDIKSHDDWLELRGLWAKINLYFNL